MISIPLFKREIKANYKILLIFAGVLTMYLSMIISMFDPNIGKTLDELSKSMPQLMTAFGMNDMGRTLTEFLASYLYGFLLLAFPMIFEIVISNRLIARYVDRGSMAYLLATPNTRKKIAFTQALFMWLSLAVLIAFVTVLGIIFCNAMFPDELDVGKFVMLNVGVYLLHIAISGFCYFASCVSNDAKTSYAVGAGVPIAFYLIQMLANMGGKLENLKYATVFTLFNPKNIVAGENDIVWALIALFGIGLVFYSLGIYLFTKRDLPL